MWKRCCCEGLSWVCAANAAAAVCELQVHLVAAALQRGPQSLEELLPHALQLIRQQKVSFAALEAALLLLRRRGLQEGYDEVCSLLQQQQHHQQQQQQQEPDTTRIRTLAYCEALVHKCASATNPKPYTLNSQSLIYAFSQQQQQQPRSPCCCFCLTGAADGAVGQRLRCSGLLLLKSCRCCSSCLCSSSWSCCCAPLVLLNQNGCSRVQHASV